MDDRASSITIVVEDGGAAGRYVGRVAGIDAEAELNFTRPRPGVVSADHVGAPPALRGSGVAAALVDRLVADARAQGFRIAPRCSYVRALHARHPEWSDAFVER